MKNTLLLLTLLSLSNLRADWKSILFTSHPTTTAIAHTTIALVPAYLLYNRYHETYCIDGKYTHGFCARVCNYIMVGRIKNSYIKPKGVNLPDLIAAGALTGLLILTHSSLLKIFQQQ